MAPRPSVLPSGCAGHRGREVGLAIVPRLWGQDSSPVGLGARAEAPVGAMARAWGSVAERDRPTRLSAPGKERTGPYAGV